MVRIYCNNCRYKLTNVTHGPNHQIIDGATVFTIQCPCCCSVFFKCDGSCGDKRTFFVNEKTMKNHLSHFHTDPVNHDEDIHDQSDCGNASFAADPGPEFEEACPLASEQSKSILTNMMPRTSILNSCYYDQIGSKSIFLSWCRNGIIDESYLVSASRIS